MCHHSRMKKLILALLLALPVTFADDVLIRDATENALGLPSGVYEVPLAIADRSFNTDGSFDYPATVQEVFFGDTITVNGKVWPRFDVDQGKYRFRVLNASNSRHLTLEFCPGSQPTSPCPSPATCKPSNSWARSMCVRCRSTIIHSRQ